MPEQWEPCVTLSVGPVDESPFPTSWSAAGLYMQKSPQGLPRT